MKRNNFRVWLWTIILGYMILANYQLIAQKQNIQGLMSVAEMDASLNLTDLQEAEVNRLMIRQQQLMRQIIKLRKENPQEAKRRYSELRQNHDFELAAILGRDQWVVYQQIMADKEEIAYAKSAQDVAIPTRNDTKQKKAKKEKAGSGTGKQMLTGGIGFLTSELVRYGMKWLRRNSR